MLKIRLRRMGSTHRPFFRVVVSDSRRTPTAASIEEIGYYDPRKNPSVVKIETDRVEYWTSKGAQLSDAVRKLVKQQASGVVGTFASATSEPVKTEDTAKAPAEEKAEAKAEEKAEAPAEAKAEAKAEEKAEAPAEEKAEAKAEEKVEAPAEEKAEKSAETTEAASA